MRRRTLLVSGLVGSGALLVGAAVLPMRSRLGHRDLLPLQGGEVGLNGWIKVRPDGSVVLAMPRSEMGQGVHAALAMVVAEELDIAPAAVQLEQAGHESLYGNVAGSVEAMLWFEPGDVEPGRETAAVRASRWVLGKLVRELGVNATGGSSSIADLAPLLAVAAATARAQLLGAASLQWKLPVAELAVDDGIVVHPSGSHAHFGQLARAAAGTPPGDVVLKRREQWRHVGRGAPRPDVPDKVTGRARYAIDVREPGQLYATVLHAPLLGGSPGAVDVDALLAQPGVLRVVRLPSYAGSAPALAIVARTSWHALQAARGAKVDWRAPPGWPPDSGTVLRTLQHEARDAAAGRAGHAFRERGDALAGVAQAARTLVADYRAPYLAHATMEPMNCTARVRDGRVAVWVGTQVPGFARAVAAQAAGVREDAVDVHVTLLGGGFGRRLEVDVVGQAVRVAVETQPAPVQLVWSREEDLRRDFYRPAAAARFEAALDAQGRVTALSVGTAGDAILPRYYERVFPLLAAPVDLPDKTTAEGLFDLPYALPHLHVRHRATRHGVPVGSWRSVGHSQNAFFAECFVDELAEAAGADPLSFRLERLHGLPRHAAVLALAAERAGWGRPPPAGRALGLALHESFGTIVAMVVEASRAEAQVRVHRVVAAVDCGTVIDPGIVRQQVESSVVWGLTAALHGRIDIEDGRVRQTNFDRCRLLTLAETPAIETHLVASTRAPGGMGEPAVPPVAPALANALYRLTGRRLRELPLQP